jgi:hypothetical protein
MNIKPKQKRDWLVAAGLIFWVIAEVGRKTIVPPHDPLSSSDATTVDWLFRVLRDISIITIISTLLITGIRDIRMEGMNLKRILSPLLAGLFCLFLTGVSIYGYLTLSKAGELFNEEVGIAKLEKYLNNNTIEAEAYPRASLMYAKIKYVNYGEIVPYVTEARETIEFSPTPEIKEQRKKYLWSKEAMSWSQKSMRSNIYFWPVVLVVNLLLGFFIPANNKMKLST